LSAVEYLSANFMMNMPPFYYIQLYIHIHHCMYHSLTKEYPWVVQLTCLPNRGVDALCMFSHTHLSLVCTG